MDYMTTSEAANYAGVERNTILYWIRKGYLGDDVKKQNVLRGSGNGYKIPKDRLSKYLHGWTITEEVKTKPEPKYEKKDVLEKISDLRYDKESLKMAAANLRIAIEFAQEELKKIETILLK